jgi:hypothetical protein
MSSPNLTFYTPLPQRPVGHRPGDPGGDDLAVVSYMDESVVDRVPDDQAVLRGIVVAGTPVRWHYDD